GPLGVRSFMRTHRVMAGDGSFVWRPLVSLQHTGACAPTASVVCGSVLVDSITQRQSSWASAAVWRGDLRSLSGVGVSLSAQRGYAFAVDRLSRLNDFLQRCFGIRVIRFQRERAEPVTKTSANSSNSRSNTGSLSQSEKEKLPDD